MANNSFYPEDLLKKGADDGFEAHSESELRELQGKLNKMLPVRGLKDMNLEQELLLQYQRVLGLQEEVLRDGDIPANQRAQVAGQVASTLQHLIKLQEDLQLATTLRLMEEALSEAVQLLPDAAKHAFFAQYEVLAKGKGL